MRGDRRTRNRNRSRCAQFVGENEVQQSALQAQDSYLRLLHLEHLGEHAAYLSRRYILVHKVLERRHIRCYRGTLAHMLSTPRSRRKTTQKYPQIEHHTSRASPPDLE